eukprot:gene5201-15400_t
MPCCVLNTSHAAITAYDDELDHGKLTASSRRRREYATSIGGRRVGAA